MNKIKIYEIFKSIQGESSFAGLPFGFIRFSGCNLRCLYCDTKYAYTNGKYLTIFQIINKIKKFKIKNILITGGEPLLQINVKHLINALLKLKYKVFVETNGSISTKDFSKNVTYIIDVKTPSSGMHIKMHEDNFKNKLKNSEFKFVIANRIDYIYSKKIMKKFNLNNNVLFSCVFNKLKPDILAKWILKDKIDVRLQLQLHKYIWDPNIKGV